MSLLQFSATPKYTWLNVKAFLDLFLGKLPLLWLSLKLKKRCTFKKQALEKCSMQIIEILELFAFSIILRSYRTDLELFEMKHELFFDSFLF